MKLLKVFVWALLLLPITSHAVDLDKELVEKMLNATVRVVNYQEGRVLGTGVGAGVIISKSGLILTNYHVVHKSQELKVYLWKDRYRKPHAAKVIGTDPIADLALLDIDPRPNEVLRPAELESEVPDIYAGTEVIAVGHPLSLQWSVSRGIINAINRSSFITPYVFLIQHDAAINEGNSGGPLFNAKGNLIGINTYIIAPKDSGYSGMGYAVQLDSVSRSLTQMMELGVVIRPALKLNIIPLTDDLRNFIEQKEDPAPFIPNTFGVVMNFLEEEALEQGLQNFDVIVAMDGFPINDMRDIATIMYDKTPGQTVYLLINRNGEFVLKPYVLGSLDMDLTYYDRGDRSSVPPKREKPKDTESPTKE